MIVPVYVDYNATEVVVIYLLITKASTGFLYSLLSSYIYLLIISNDVLRNGYPLAVLG